MVAMGMGSNKRILAWYVGLLVVGLLLVSAAGQYCEGICGNSKMYDACMRWCQLNGRLINQKHRQEATAVQVQLGATTVGRVIPDCFTVCHNSKDHDACMSWCQQFGPRISKKHPQEAAAVQVHLGTTKAAKETQGGKARGGATDVLTQAAAEEAPRVRREMTCLEFCVRNAWRFPGKYDGCMLVWCEAGSQLTKQINNNVDKHRTDVGTDGVSSSAK